MPKSAFLHKKSLLDTFKDDYKVTNPIKAARAERTWDNPIVRHKREREINKWAHSFAGKKHIRKLTRFNATHEELMNEASRLRYPLEDVAKVANDALRTFRTRMWRVDVYSRFLADGTEIGTAVATDIAHRNFPYRWEFRGDLVARLMKGDEIIEEFHANDLDDLHEFLLDEGEVNEAKMKIKVRESKKNEKDEPTYVWFGLEPDVDGESTDTVAVFVDDVHDGMVTTYAHIGQHSDASLDYIADLEADPNPKGDLYKELIRQGYDNLVVVNTDVAEDMLGIRMHPGDDARELEDPDKYDKYEAYRRMTAWTYLERLGKLEGDDSRKEATGKMLDALGYTQGTEGRWYDDEGDEVDIIDVLDNTEWDKAVTMCGPLQESKKSEAYYKGKDRGFLVLVQKLIANNWYARARKEFPGLTLDCYEMDGAGDDMKICFEAYGEEIDDPMSEGLMEIAEESAKKGCATANRSTDPRIADYGLEANFISWDEPDVFRDQWSYVINLSSKPKGKKGEGYGGTKSVMSIWGNRPRDVYPEVSYSSVNDMYNTLLKYGYGDKHPIYYKTNSPEQIKGHILGYFKWTPTNSDADIEADALAAATMIKNNFNKSEAKKVANEKLGYEKGHKNSKGEPAPWVIRSHKDNSVLASFANKDDAYAHLQRMKQYSTSESRMSDSDIVDYLDWAGYWKNDKESSYLGELIFTHGKDVLKVSKYVPGTKNKDDLKSDEYNVSLYKDKGLYKSMEPGVKPDSVERLFARDVIARYKDGIPVADESFHKVQVKDTLFDILKKHGINDKAKVSYDGDAIVCEYDGTTLRIDNDLALTAKMQDKTIDRKYGTLADLSADLDKYFTKYVKEALEKNGVIVVPEWLWVAYETGDSSNLSVEEEQILDGFKAMAAGKVFDAEAEPSFRAFNDFDDYAGNCYEVQVYTIKEGK